MRDVSSTRDTGFMTASQAPAGAGGENLIVESLVILFLFLPFFSFYFQLEDNYDIVMVFAVRQHASHIGIHVCPPP